MRFEPTPAVAAPALSTLNVEELKIVAWLAAAVRRDIRKKDISLRGLRSIDGTKPLYNPYHSSRRNITPELWARVMVAVGRRIDETCTGLVDLERRAELAIEVATTKCVAAVSCEGVDREELSVKIDREMDNPKSPKAVTRGYLVEHIDHMAESYIKNGLTAQEATVLYHLDNCRAYCVVDRAEHFELFNRVIDTGSKAGDYRTERQEAILKALRDALQKGSSVKAAIWLATA